MINHSKDVSLTMRYLLGEVSPEERAEFEEKYFAQDALFEEIVAAENDLIDSYVRGTLSAVRRKRFEDRFMAAPEYIEKVRFAKSLMHNAPPAKIAAIREKGPRWYVNSLEHSLLRPAPAVQIALLGAMAIAMGISGWLAYVNQRLRHELAQVQLQQNVISRRNHDLQQQWDALMAQSHERIHNSGGQTQVSPAGPDVLSLVLTPGLRRSAGRRNELRLSRNVAAVHLQLNLEHGTYSRYEASLETAEGTPVLRIREVRARKISDGGQAVMLAFPARILKNGDYLLTLSATSAAGKTEALESYMFLVVKK